MVNKATANVGSQGLTETGQAKESHFAVTRSYLLFPEIKGTREKLRIQTDFYPESNMVWKSVAANLPSGKWEALANEHLDV